MPGVSQASAQTQTPATSPQQSQQPQQAPSQDPQETVGNAAVAQQVQNRPPGEPVDLPTPLDLSCQGDDTSVTDGGSRSLSGANARWEGVPSIRTVAEERDGQWFVNVQNFDVDFTFWLNSGATWNTIDQFPGGAYDAGFNMPEGSTRHERAEIAGVIVLWSTMEAHVRAGVAGGQESEAAAQAHYNSTLTTAAAPYRTGADAISDHSNPVGPNAEWAYYQQEHARYEAERDVAEQEEEAGAEAGAGS